MDYLRVFGKIESIVSVFYLNSCVYSTTFAFRIFNTEKSNWSHELRFLDFYGIVPDSYVGKEAMYFGQNPSCVDDREAVSRLDEFIANIEIGKITSRGNGAYDIKEEIGNPTIPTRIRSRYICKSLDQKV